MSTLSITSNPIWKSRTFTHGTFWVGTVFLLSYHSSLFGGAFTENLVYMLSILPVQMIAAYAFSYYQVPQWLYQGSWWKFIMGSAIVAYILAALARASVIYIGEPLMGVDGIDESIWEILTDPLYLIRVYMISAYLPAVLFFLIKMTKSVYEKENQLVELEKEKQTAELKFLKAQINPHFLFNTLNNIYALARKKSDDTPDMILKLSEILDYTIYECTSDRVSVIKEWELVENYADLQALRHHDQMTIVLNQEINNRSAQVAPLILISLVENAFKHVLKGKRQGATVEIELVVTTDQIVFKTYNTRSLDSRNRNKGIGLQNIKRQLQLLYPDRHSMQVDAKDDSYQVTLTLDIN